MLEGEAKTGACCDKRTATSEHAWKKTALGPSSELHVTQTFVHTGDFGTVKDDHGKPVDTGEHGDTATETDEKSAVLHWNETRHQFAGGEDLWSARVPGV